ncbi:MAG: glycosyltransferase family 39 protein [Candidatus Eisenbacteria bacterium]|nr:glycosyltransferase family 39 protein [Candidatus Eisenbacteria bacterium]
MTAFFSAGIALVLLVAAGEGLLLLLRVGMRRAGLLDRLVASFGSGAAVVGTWSLALALLGVPASGPLLAIPVLLYPAGRILGRGGPIDSVWTRESAPRSVWALLALAVALAQVAYAFRQAVLRPIHSWDAWRIWSFRAKILYIEKGFPEGFFDGDWAGFPGYPLGIPFVEAYLARAAGMWHEPAIKMLFPLFLAALLFVSWRLLAERTDGRTAGLGLLLLASAPLLVHHGSVAYMDLPLAFFLASSVLHLSRWEREKDGGSLATAALFAGFLPVIKNEGLPFFLLLSAIVVVRRTGRGGGRALLRWFAISLPFSLPWLLFKHLGGIAESPYHVLSFPDPASIARRAYDCARLSAANMTLTGSWGLAWFALVFLLLPGRALRRGVPEIVLAGGAILFAAAYCLTESYTFLLNGTALGRNLLVLLPLAVAACLTALFDAGARRNAPSGTR